MSNRPSLKTAKDGHRYMKPDIVTTVRVPRKADDPKKRQHGRKKPNSVGESKVYEWADGTGVVRVGRTTVKIMKGETDLSEWTDEELMRGAPMHVSRIPHVIPMAVYVELIGRVQAQVRHRFAAEMMIAVDHHLRLIKDPYTPPNVKMSAIKELYDRVLGKAPENITVHDGDAPWRKLIANAIVGTVEEAKALNEGTITGAEIVEGEIVEEDSV